MWIFILATLKNPQISTFTNPFLEAHPQHISKFHSSRYISRGLPYQDGINRFLILCPTIAAEIAKVDPSQNFLAQSEYYLSEEHP